MGKPVSRKRPYRNPSLNEASNVRKNIAINDVVGNFSLTLIDVLDTFVVLGDRPGFEAAVKDVISWVSFDVNTKPQVFETTIRVLGGLLSGHIFASQPGQPFNLPWYRKELLDMAYDLGKRLLPAFNTPTGLPYARVNIVTCNHFSMLNPATNLKINLRRGLVKGESVETCSFCSHVELGIPDLVLVRHCGRGFINSGICDSKSIDG